VRFNESILALKLSESPPIPLTDVQEKIKMSHNLCIRELLAP
jgi:hypothetical protein